MPMIRIALLLVVVLVACTAPASGPEATGDPSGGASLDVGVAATAEDGVELHEGWRLREVTADGKHVALVVEHGACDGYIGPRVVADGVAGVVIEVAYDPPEGVVSCNAMGLVEREVVELPTPLDGRLLTGCGYEDCRTVPEDAGFDGRGDGAAVAAGVAVVVVDRGVVALDVLDGGELWRIDHDEEGQRFLEDPTALGDVVLLVDQIAAQDVIAVDASTGQTRWEASGRNPWGYLRQQVTSADADEALVLLTPRAGLVETAEGWQGGVVEARRVDGSVAWTVAVQGQVFEVDIAGDIAVVVSGRNMDAADQLGHTTVTALNVTTGEVRWQAPLAGQPFDVVLRPELGEDGLVVVDVLGATYGLSLADGGEVWRNVPLNYGGMVDVGPSVLLSPARYGDPHLLVDPATGAEVGTARPADWYGLDISLYPRVEDEVIMPRPGELVRRDVDTIPLTESDPDPTWAVALLAQAGPPALVDERTVVVPTPLGARRHDATTGELLWAYADLP